MTHRKPNGTAETMVDTTAHSPTPCPLPPVGRSSCIGNWRREDAARHLASQLHATMHDAFGFSEVAA